MTRQDVLDQACAWFVALREKSPSQQTREDFARWLLEAPAHARTYLEITALWSDALAVDPDKTIDVNALIEHAEAEDKVTQLGTRHRPSLPKASVAGKRFLALAGALAAVVATVVIGIGPWRQPSESMYSTAVGERSTIRLADGSLVELNARSRIQVNLTARQRTIDLQHGQALFTVAHDSERPFIVRAGDGAVRAVGTQFDVDRRTTFTTVTVIEGKVEVRADAGPEPSAAQLGAGDQIRILEGGALLPTLRVDPALATSWSRGELIFRSATLQEVADEFNRYNTRRLVVTDVGLEHVRISAVFSSTDPAALLRFLSQQPDLRVLEKGSEIKILPR